MTQRLSLTNYARFNLSSILHAGDVTLAPPSYAGFPASGQFPLVCQDNLEIIYVTDASARPWAISRGNEGSVAADHAIGTLLRLDPTAGAFGILLAGYQAGALAAVGRDLDVVGGIGVTQGAGTKITVQGIRYGPLLDHQSDNVVVDHDGTPLFDHDGSLLLDHDVTTGGINPSLVLDHTGGAIMVPEDL